MTDQTQPTPPQVEVVDPEPLAPTDYTRSNRQQVEVPEDVGDSAASLSAWVTDAPESEREARARAARELNDARDTPWVSVTKAVDGVLG